MLSLISRMLIYSVLALTLLGGAGLNAQEDPIAYAKTFPPKLVAIKQNEVGLEVVGWQLVQLERLVREYRMMNDELMMEIKKKSSNLKEIAAQIPDIHRGLDSATRSRLAGNVLEKLFDARLDLAANEATIAKLAQQLKDEKKNGPGEAIQRELRIDLEAATLKAQVSKEEYDKAKKLAATGTVSSSELRMAKYTLQVSELGRAKAALKLESATSEKASAIADELVNLRIESEPVKSKIKTAEEILKSFSDSQALFDKQEEIEDELLGWQKDKRAVAQQLIKVSQELVEMETLQKLIKAELKKSKNKVEKNDNQKAGEKNDASVFEKAK